MSKYRSSSLKSNLLWYKTTKIMFKITVQIRNFMNKKKLYLCKSNTKNEITQKFSLHNY